MQRKVGFGIKIIAILVYAFLAAPLIIVIISSFSPSACLKFPPDEFSIKWYLNIFNGYGFERGFIYSLILACVTTLIDIIIGVAGALCIAKYNFRGKEFLTNFFTSPMFLPGITFGFVLLQVFSISLFQTMPAFVKLMIGHCVIILPYIMRNVISVSIGFNWKLEEAAQSLGATALQSFNKITFPLIKPGVIAGGLLAFLFSLDDATLSAFLTNPKFITLPVRMLSYMEYAFDPTLAAISTVLIIMSVTTIILVEKYIGLDMFLE
jgi:putative spermidine/putrescine transport system permease protein